MPRDGSGASDNAVENTNNIAHGAAENDPASSGVDRSSKAAPMPEVEKGEAFEGMGASGGGSAGETLNGSGKGESIVWKDAGPKTE